MANSLLTGISGLRVHQKMLEVIGNNLANLNTTAFKSSRTLFQDMMYELQRGATSGGTAVLGSVNAVQIGTGATLSTVDMNFTQGNLDTTGKDFDLAIDGGGFFVASSGEQTLYTRSGAFSLDENGYLVDPATGYLIKRSGSLGEPDGINPAFQIPGDDRLLVPIGTSIPGKVSTKVSVSGNLSSLSTGPVAQTFRTSSPLLSGGVPATGATLLNNLDSNTVDYIAGDRIMFGGILPDGSTPTPNSVTVGPATTVDDLLNAMRASFPGTTFSLDTLGHMRVMDNDTGPSSLSISFFDGPTNTGLSSLSTHAFVQTALGKNADTVFRTVEVFDERGVGHNVNLKFTKQPNNTWNMESLIDPAEGIVLDGVVEGIEFKSDGSFQQVTGTGVGDIDLTFQFTTSPSPQTVVLDFGMPGSFEGLNELGNSNTVTALADGFEPGQLAGVQIDSDGTIFGLSSNGKMIPLGQVAIAAFRNVDGLISAGGNYFQASLASGGAEIGAALSGGRGAVRAKQLEGSNVDMALEFTKLIVAQRGFSANARTITVADEVLKELTSVIR